MKMCLNETYSKVRVR